MRERETHALGICTAVGRKREGGGGAGCVTHRVFQFVLMRTEREKDRNGKEREKRNRAVKGTTKEKRKKCFVKYIGLANFPKFIFPESKLYLK